MSESLYERLGGESAIKKTVDIFYKKVLADPYINYFFEGVDIERIARMQKSFLTFAFGGSPKYPGRPLRNVHARVVERGANDSHFDTAVEHLVSALKELNIPDELIREAVQIVEGTRNDVLGR